MSTVSPKTLKPTRIRFEVWDAQNDSRAKDMYSLWLLEHPDTKISLNRFRELAAVGHGFLLAYHEKKPIGYVWFNYQDRSRGRKAIVTLEYFLVRSQRGKDLPQKLIEGITIFARSHGMSLVHMLHNNPRMIEHLTQLKHRNQVIRAKNPKITPSTSIRIRTKQTGPFRDAFISIRPKRK